LNRARGQGIVQAAQRQRRIFDDFRRTLPSEIRSAEWNHRGLGPPIDFVSPNLRTGVELTEWLGENESQYVQERDRFREELLEAIAARGPERFRPGGAGCTAVVSVISGPPRRREKPAIVARLLEFLGDFENSRRIRFQTDGIFEVAIPPDLKPYFDALTLYDFPSNNLGIVVQRARNGGSDVALRSFRDRLRAKVVYGFERYSAEKRRLELKELWLVIHYSSPGVFIEPMIEMGLHVGFGEHRRKTQEVVAAKLTPIAREIGGGAFDRIWFLVDCQPEPFSQEIFVAHL
jgi:hypothetical protein